MSLPELQMAETSSNGSSSSSSCASLLDLGTSHDLARRISDDSETNWSDLGSSPKDHPEYYSMEHSAITPKAELAQPSWPLDPTPKKSSFKSDKSESYAEIQRPYEMQGSLCGLLPNLQSKGSPVSPTTSNSSRLVAASEVTGCSISAAISPPAHYPKSRRASIQLPAGGNASEPPRWARPTAAPDVTPGRSQSFSLPRPDASEIVPELPELPENESGDWIEMMKSSEGRIAVQSGKEIYEILVWLPGFQLENITISSRGLRTVRIVADQWDENDHAQWDIKLGDDADMRSIRAKFTGEELRITVPRTIAVLPSSRSHMTSSSAPPRIRQTASYGPQRRQN